ncbi:hypothetical protein BC827DRAFT_1155036 [Russula dissimulans]|nr:hypothetical protein BC827DRAFT_1155036 [Russula dissimulans]
MNGTTAPSQNMSLLAKWGMVSRTLYKSKIVILALQETHLTQESAETICTCLGKNMEILFSENPTFPQATAGVAFMINKALINPKQIKTVNLVPGRAQILRIKWLETCKTTLLNIYAPNNATEHQTFWDTIERERTSANLPKPNFMLGDFNIMEDLINRAPTRKDNRQATEALRNIHQKWDLQDQ